MSGLRIHRQRLLDRIEALAQIGAIAGGGVCRLALTEEDKAGRDQVVAWMQELGLTISIDQIGNVIGLRDGLEAGEPVLIGSHIDTVRTGGRYDGNLGVLAGLEVVATLNDAGMQTRRPIAVAFFTNEEGARFAPDMMGSMVHQGHLSLDTMLNTTGIDGQTVGDCLQHIGYAGPISCGDYRAHAFIELHIEQGPILERENIAIGAVEGVQGISWTEITIQGVANHAGTTPMSMRCDAGFAAASITVFVRELAHELGGDQVATVGALNLSPNLVNVIPQQAIMTVDLRNTSETQLQEAETRLHSYLQQLTETEGITISHRSLARFSPVAFDTGMISRVENQAKALGLSVRRMPSGAGHDAQAFAPNRPTGMIFVPSVAGISHNVNEFTATQDLENGANVLLGVVLELAD